MQSSDINRWLSEKFRGNFYKIQILSAVINAPTHTVLIYATIPIQQWFIYWCISSPIINLMGSLQITKAHHIVTNMAPHMELHPLASMPPYTVVPSVISRVHYVVVHPPTNILTNMTPNIVVYMYLQSRSYLEDNRAGVAE